jgi:hypothetical protein
VNYYPLKYKVLMSYRKKMATIAKFLEENGMANPLTTEPPSHLILQDLLHQADELLEKSHHSRRILDSFYVPARQLEEQFYTGDNFQRILYIDSYRRAHGLDPLFNVAHPFPSQDKLTGAISHGFEMAKLIFARLQSGREKEEEFEKTQSYAYRMIDVLESTYMS